MLIKEYLQMRIKVAESALAIEKLARNEPKAMAEQSAIAELRGMKSFLKDAEDEDSRFCENCDNEAVYRLCDNCLCDKIYEANTIKTTIEKMETIKPCSRLSDCAYVRIRGMCIGPICGVYDPAVD